ncbi:mycothiol synthase [Leifsonia sp. ALI-44-B]|jgi:mycothiol synthase|uniref:mycothiol synthase n=1 Tax=Leifsonia sp. ALI-44-B TaxID=1933776 RepID=UPI00097CAF16|nr:mycothiol synthase [Leifsonia sp. ALI-44-B]ONI64148.1 mycothiol synthase [Leifsonia sp. ALI-44-B]
MRRLTLRVHNLSDADVADVFWRIVRRAEAVDGQPPFNDQALVDVRAGSRTLIALVEPSDDEPGDTIIGAAILGQGELDLVLDPEWRGVGFGGAALTGLLGSASPHLTAWSHGDHPAARALAESHGFDRVRTLLQLRMPLSDGDAAAPVSGAGTGGVTIRSFDADTDAEAWVALNARIFAHHPEQGKMTVADLAARQDEEWFDAGDFLLAVDEQGDLIGYNWLKVEDDLGEIYVLGVSPDAAGRGLGRTLTNAGLARLRERGVSTAALYVEADNEPAVRLYRSVGFADHTIDVQYRRKSSAQASSAQV